MTIVEFNYAGSLRLEKIALNPEHVVSVQKPKSPDFGCILSTSSGEKFPVMETYGEALAMLASPKV